MNERWDGDQTGSGVSDGGPFVPPRIARAKTSIEASTR